MVALILLSVVAIISFIVYQLVLKNLDKKDTIEKEKNMKDYDKYHNQLEDLKTKIKELNDIGIKNYTNNFVWKKFKSSILLKLAIISPFLSSFVLTIQKVEPIYYTISILIPLGFISIALFLYRVINMEKLSKDGASEFMEFSTKYRTEYIEVEYNKISSAIKSLKNTTVYTIKSLELLKTFNKLYLDVLDVINKQSVMNDSVKADLLDIVNKSFKQGIDVSKEIHDILLVEDKIDRNNISSILQEKSNKNIIDLQNYFDVLEKINNSLSITILDIPKVSSDKSTIDEVNSALKDLENSMDAALAVSNSLKNYNLKTKDYTY